MITSVIALAAFVWYAGIKGAYISTVFATFVVERNVIYLCPILFAATAMAIARGIGRGWAIAAAAVFTVYVVASTPLHLDSFPYYEAHGLSIAAFANRKLGWPEGRIETALIVVCALALIFAIAIRSLRIESRAYRIVAGTAAALVVAWSLTAQVYAAEGERDLSKRSATNFAKPYDWVDRATGGKSVVVIGQQISDPTNVQLTEFFNTSIRKMWSLDGSAINVGAPILTPDLEASDGTLTPSPETQYALALNGVELRAPVVEHHGQDTLYRLDGGPMKLAAAVTGRESDGWVVGSSDDPVARASYTRYDVSHDPRGFVVVKLSRLGWCPKPPRQTRAIVAHRNRRSRPGQATRHLARTGHAKSRREGLHHDRRRARDPDRSLARRGCDRTDSHPERGGSVEQRATATRRDVVGRPPAVQPGLDADRSAPPPHRGACRSGCAARRS